MTAGLIAVGIGLVLGCLRYLNRRRSYTDLIRDFKDELKKP